MTRRLYAVSAVALLLLTGCSAGAPDASEPDTARSAAAPVTPAAADPLVAAPPSETPASDSTTADQAFLDAIHEARAGKILSSRTQIPDATDAQLLEAGAEACERIAAGEPTETMSLIAGETQDAAGYFTDSSAIIGAATKTLCR